MVYRISYLIIILFFIISCSDNQRSNSHKTTENNYLNGTWTSCSIVDLMNSQNVIININDDDFSEVISSYENITDCSGIPIDIQTLSGVIEVGIYGDSEFEVGATNITLILDNVDIFGCGSENPAYTYLKLSEDHNSFSSAASNPSCSPHNRGSGFSLLFIKI